MAHIVPFKAVRPSKKHLQYFSSKSYKNYTEEELQNTLAKNPLSFLSIIHLKKHLSDSMTKAERYMLVKNKYEDFKATNVLIKDETPCEKVARKPSKTFGHCENNPTKRNCRQSSKY